MTDTGHSPSPLHANHALNAGRTHPISRFCGHRVIAGETSKYCQTSGLHALAEAPSIILAELPPVAAVAAAYLDFLDICTFECNKMDTADLPMQTTYNAQCSKSLHLMRVFGRSTRAIESLGLPNLLFIAKCSTFRQHLNLFMPSGHVKVRLKRVASHRLWCPYSDAFLETI